MIPLSSNKSNIINLDVEKMHFFKKWDMDSVCEEKQ